MQSPGTAPRPSRMRHTMSKSSPGNIDSSSKANKGANSIPKPCMLNTAAVFRPRLAVSDDSEEIVADRGYSPPMPMPRMNRHAASTAKTDNEPI